jgi:hypothetical protein
MREWLPKRTTYLRQMLSTEGNEGQTCTHCERPARWRCLCCLGRPMYCRECCRVYHRQLIHHRIQKWTGLFFQDASLWEVGVRLCVGHMGQDCPSQEALLGACRITEAQKDDLDNLSVTQYNFGPIPNQPVFQANYNPDPPDPINDEDDPDDPGWEDVPMFSHTDSAVPLKTPTPTMDEHDLHHLLIVDSSGLISLPVIWCACDDAASQRDLLLLDLQMWTASYENIKTVFTFACLDDYRLSNLECKTSAYQYYQKLRRLTNPAFPQSVPNRYHEFRRATRQWRNLKLRKWFGFGHRLVSPSKGSLALFCAACPQPTVNLPTDHLTRYTA